MKFLRAHTIRLVFPIVLDAVLVSVTKLCPRRVFPLIYSKYQFFKVLSPSESVTVGLKTVNWGNINIRMGKTAGGFYAVARGRSVGIFTTWDECKAQVNGFNNARYKKFPSKQEAESFITEHGGILPAKSNSTDFKPATGLGKLGSSTSSSSKAASSSSSSSSSTQFFPQQSTRSTILTEPLWKRPPINKRTALEMTGPVVLTNAREFSTSTGLNKRAALKVTEDRVTGRKRAKLDIESANAGVDLTRYSVDEEGYVVVFTDGACRANGKRGARAGIGVWFGDDHSLNISERVKGRQTNNTAEIQAAERAITQAKSNGIGKLKLMTDSQFTINCVTKWLSNWKRNGWKLGTGSDVKNKEDLEKLDKAMQGIEIKWSYVAGHKGHYGNEAADRLAVLGSQMN